MRLDVTGHSDMDFVLRRTGGYNMFNTVEFSRKSLAQIQASSGSGPSESEGALAVLTAPRRNAGIRQPSASQK